MERTPVYDTYWRFAAERHAVYTRRLTDPDGPWKDDPIISGHRFTNAYRVLDRVSQRLVRDVQYGPYCGTYVEPEETLFRTLLFKVFNREDVWDELCEAIGTPKLEDLEDGSIREVLDARLARKDRLYSAAYIMASPQKYGHERKHHNHLALLEDMFLCSDFPDRVAEAPSLEAVFREIKRWPGMGDFLAYQYAVDVNYSDVVDFDEDDFVVPGPGCLDGVSRCFSDWRSVDPVEAVRHMTRVQEEEFDRLGLRFDGLFGRRLRLIDCQNLFCEVSKYARVAHPEVESRTGRTRIKQTFSPASRPGLPFLPPKWGVTVPEQWEL